MTNITKESISFSYPTLKPSIGMIVHYQRYGSPNGEHLSEPSPAVITQILNEETQECMLFIMNPNGLYFNKTYYSDNPKSGCWNWPTIAR